MFSALIASALSSFLGLIGGFSLLAGRTVVARWSRYLVSFAAGAMLGAAFFDLLTEAVNEFPDSVSSVFAWVMVGFLVFFMIERLLLWHHHGHDEAAHPTQPSLAPLVIIGDAVHNLIDGLVIGTVFLVNPAIGITTAIAVLAHELPQEIGDFSILLHSGMSRKKIALWNLLGALISPIGTILAFTAITRIDGLEMPLLGLSAGMFIYIAAADLVPEIHRERKPSIMVKQIALLAFGILTIVAVGRIFPHGG
ncbi:MAG: ZIP family metal transporter [Candidatus Kerfeldbacteria bacterium]|nr:ZIP family metal transporter [Candidatus Kerfeldbacteria bacterium]